MLKMKAGHSDIISWPFQIYANATTKNIYSIDDAKILQKNCRNVGIGILKYWG